jgi:hypothetical protein
MASRLKLPINVIRELDGERFMIVVQGSKLQDAAAPAA